jgi:hypothetical protein
MGNIQIKDIQENNKLDETINSLLYKYIASLNYNNLIELSSKVNSTKLITKLSELLSSLKNEQINYLLEKKQIESTNDFLKNCMKLADYYVLIINLFTSITLTLIVHPTLEFKKIQLNTIERNFNRNILAGNRLAILLNNKNIKEFQEKYHNGRITINSDICNFNQKGGDGSTTTISETSIIPELEELYYDKYDQNTGKFFGMTSKMKKKYKTDLDSFYKTLTGTNTPANITKFQEISLSHYLDNPSSSPISSSTSSSTSSPSSSFVNYIENINSILELITKYNTTLMDVLKEIFNYNGMDEGGKREIAINSELTLEYIVKLTRTTINTIKEFYMYCEILYAKGVKIYIDIVNLQLLDTSAHQIENLKFMADHISLQQCSALDDIPSLYHSKD